MFNLLIDSLSDCLKLLPFIFVAFFIIELLEHKFEEYSEKLLSISRRFGPLFGSLLGLFPECGFSIMATGLYATRVITLGTLVAIYLSTSDEMLVVMMSGGASANEIIKILSIKFVVGLIAGLIIDIFFRNKNLGFHMDKSGHEEHKNVLKEAIEHSFKTFVFLLLASFMLNVIMSIVPYATLERMLSGSALLSSMISGLIGLIPNCSASIMISTIYLRGLIPLGTAMSGLLSSSGMALMVLFKENGNKKENVSILLCVYLISVIAGVAISCLF